MILNEQLIQDMFQDEPELPSLPREDISLNFTNTSRDSKHKKSPSIEHTGEIAIMAQTHLAKFQAWVDEQSKALRMEDLNALIDTIETAAAEAVDQQDLVIIKGELFRHEELQQHPQNECGECLIKAKRIQELEEANNNQEETLKLQARQLVAMREQSIRQAVEQVREYLLTGAENGALKSEIRELHQQINALKNEKITLQRTFLFNKTRNSDVNILQKSKDLSAAKNSTNSSQINRNHQAIVFIDPIESDVDEWLKFFQAQRTRYRHLCRKEADDRQKELGRAFTREEREAFDAEDRLPVLFAAINDILRSLTRIREHTSAFEQTQLGRSGLRERGVRGEEAALREQLERTQCKLGRALKINEYIVREKQNLEEISACLKLERLKENNERNTLAELLKAETLRSSELQLKVRELQQAIRETNRALIEKEEKLLYALEDIKKLKKGGDRGLQDLQGKYRLMQKKYNEKLKELEIDRNMYILRLKKEALERRKYCNQVEEMKGVLRLYCRTTTPDETPLTDSPLFYKVIPAQDQTDRIHEDIKRLVAGAFDGFSLTVFNYGYADPIKHSFLHISQDQAPPLALRILKEVFRLIEAQKDLKVELSINICELAGERFIDLTQDRHIKPEGKEDSLSFAQCSQLAIQSYETADEIFTSLVGRRKKREVAHLIIRVSLEVHSIKTNQKYRSKISLVDLADTDRVLPSSEHSHNGKGGLGPLTKCLALFGNREKLVPCRESKLTQVLKDSFNPNSKIMMIMNVGNGKEQMRQAMTFAESCRSGAGEEARRRSISRKNI